MPAVATTFERVRDCIVEQLGVAPADVDPGATLVDDLKADSLDLVELVMSLEEEFGVDIDDEAAERIRTVGDAVWYLDRRSRNPLQSGSDVPR